MLKPIRPIRDLAAENAEALNRRLSQLERLYQRPDFNEIHEYLPQADRDLIEGSQPIDSVPPRPTTCGAGAKVDADGKASMGLNSESLDTQDPSSEDRPDQLGHIRTDDPTTAEATVCPDDAAVDSVEKHSRTASPAPVHAKDTLAEYEVDSFGKTETMDPEHSESVGSGNVTDNSESYLARQSPDASSTNGPNLLGRPLPASSASVGAANGAGGSQESDHEDPRSEYRNSHLTAENATPCLTPPIPEPPKRKGGKFAAGTSGNPKGRPPGSRNRTTFLRERLRDGEEDQLLDEMFAAASEGDKQARKAIFECLYPKCKERTIHLDLGPLENQQQVAAAESKVIKAVTDGRLGLGEGERLMKLLECQMDAVFGIYLRRSR